jgi:hypothetical protein
MTIIVNTPEIIAIGVDFAEVFSFSSIYFYLSLPLYFIKFTFEV